MSAAKVPARSQPVVSVASWVADAFSKPLLLFKSWDSAAHAHEGFPKPDKLGCFYHRLDAFTKEAAVELANERQWGAYKAGRAFTVEDVMIVSDEISLAMVVLVDEAKQKHAAAGKKKKRARVESGNADDLSMALAAEANEDQLSNGPEQPKKDDPPSSWADDFEDEPTPPPPVAEGRVPPADEDRSIAQQLEDGSKMVHELQHQVKILSFKLLEMSQMFYYSDAIAFKNYALMKNETPDGLERNVRALFGAIGLGPEGDDIKSVKRLSTTLTNSNLIRIDFKHPAAVDVVLMESARFNCEYWASCERADASIVASFSKIKANILGQMETEKLKAGNSITLANKGFLKLNRWRRPAKDGGASTGPANARGAGGKGAHSWA